MEDIIDGESNSFMISFYLRVVYMQTDTNDNMKIKTLGLPALWPCTLLQNVLHLLPCISCEKYIPSVALEFIQHASLSFAPQYFTICPSYL